MKRKLVCISCGAEFEGTMASYCPKCRKEPHGKIKTCIECGKQEPMPTHQKRCRACIEKLRYKSRENPYVNYNASIMLARMNKERAEFEKKYFQDTRCPNYGLMGTDCLGCPDGAFEFKACGRYKQEEKK